MRPAIPNEGPTNKYRQTIVPEAYDLSVTTIDLGSGQPGEDRDL